MRTIILGLLFAVAGLSQDGSAPVKVDLEAQLKAANERIEQLEIMLKQQQGLAQFFQAGQALCELYKRQTGSKDSKDDHK